MFGDLAFGDVAAQPHVVLILPLIVGDRLVAGHLGVVIVSAELEMVPEFAHVVLVALASAEVTAIHLELLHGSVWIGVFLHIFADGVHTGWAVVVVPSHDFFFEHDVDAVFADALRIEHGQSGLELLARHVAALILSHQGVVGRAHGEGRLSVHPGGHVRKQVVIPRQILVFTIDVEEGLKVDPDCINYVGKVQQSILIEVISLEKGSELGICLLVCQKVVHEGFEFGEVDFAVLVSRALVKIAVVLESLLSVVSQVLCWHLEVASGGCGGQSEDCE